MGFKLLENKPMQNLVKKITVYTGIEEEKAKAALLIILFPLLAVTWFSRQNHFEWMFNPLVHTTYAKSNEATFVNDSDMVLAVTNNGESVA